MNILKCTRMSYRNKADITHEDLFTEGKKEREEIIIGCRNINPNSHNSKIEFYISKN